MARSFNGTSDEIDFPAAAAVTGTSARTVAMWVNLASISAVGCIYSSGTPANANGTGLAVIANNVSNGMISVDTGGDEGSTNTNTINANRWTHLALTCPASTNFRTGGLIYINGVSQTLTPAGSNAGPPNTASGNVALGLRKDSGGVFYGGSIADLAVWNVVLSAGNITSLFNGVRPVNVNSANLVGWWPLDGFASPETDASGNGNTGTLTGTAQVLGPPQLWRISA